MHPNDPISKQLPLRFANGQTIRRFAKHCPACKQVVDSQYMHGIAQLVQERVVIAAQAKCPACGHTFAVTCVVTDDKEVHRVLVPGWVLRWWLGRQSADEPRLRDRDSVTKLFNVLGPRNAQRPGGYTRILKMGFRVGDNAPMAYVELVERAEEAAAAAE